MSAKAEYITRALALAANIREVPRASAYNGADTGRAILAARGALALDYMRDVARLIEAARDALDAIDPKEAGAVWQDLAGALEPFRGDS